MLVFNAVFPIFFVIIAGYFINRAFIKEEIFWKQADRLIYFILLPALLFKTTATSPLDFSMVKYGVVIFVCVTILASLTWISRRFLNCNNAGFTSVFQGIVRCNFYISLSAATLLFGPNGTAFMSFLMIFLIPSSVVYSLLVLQKFGHSNVSGLKATVIRLMKNPIVWSVSAGIFVNFTFGGLTDVLNETLSVFGRATLPLALMCVGAVLEFSSLKLSVRPIVASLILRLLLAPILCISVCYALSFGEFETICCTLIFSVPSAASSITFARQMGGDIKLMSSILTLQTIVSFVSLPIFISIIQFLI